MDRDPARIGITAKLAAYYRQFSDLPFAHDVARLIGADDAFAELVRAHALEPNALTFYGPIFEARHKSVTALVRSSGSRQVVDLASGYSMRGLELAQESFRYVEVDLPEVVATKTALLGELRRSRGLAASPEHLIVAADVLDAAQLRAALATLDRTLPVVVLCEGLLLYLSHAEIEQLARNVHELVGDAGSWITPDFTFRAEAVAVSPERQRLREAVAGVTERQLDAAAFEDADELHRFLARLGFEATVRSQMAEAGDLTSAAALGVSPDVLERLRPRLRVWTMTRLRR